VFGSCGLKNNIFRSVFTFGLQSLMALSTLVLLTFTPLPSQATEKGQEKGQEKAQARAVQKLPYIKARVLNEGANVYQEPNFDSEIIGDLGEGQTITIYPKKYYGIFYLVVFSNKQKGFVADIDISLKNSTNPDNQDAESRPLKSQNKNKAVRPPRPLRPITYTPLHGFSFSSIRYREDTMSLKPTEALSFFGLKLSGPKLLDGFPTDLDFQFYSGAPKYYEKGTGNQADGFILLTDLIFLTPIRESMNFLAFYGFGPMMKHSEFNVTLNQKSYSLVDSNLGFVFTGGAAGRIGPVVLRSEIKFHWERMTYWGWINSLQWSL
jgi:hypothetical protein